jgi:hypothetical protein
MLFRFTKSWKAILYIQDTGRGAVGSRVGRKQSGRGKREGERSRYGRKHGGRMG